MIELAATVEKLTARIETMSEILKHVNRAAQRTEIRTRPTQWKRSPVGCLPVIERKVT